MSEEKKLIRHSHHQASSLSTIKPRTLQLTQLRFIEQMNIKTKQKQMKLSQECSHGKVN